MKMRSKLTLILFVLLSLTGGGRLQSTNANREAADLKRMQFQIATIREHAGERTVISSSVVEGPPGTDFDIDLQGESFKMKARFLTDFDESRALRVRATLQTRRSTGRVWREVSGVRQWVVACAVTLRLRRLRLPRPLPLLRLPVAA